MGLKLDQSLVGHSPNFCTRPRIKPNTTRKKEKNEEEEVEEEKEERDRERPMK